MTDRGIRILVVDGEGSPAIGVIPSIGVLNEMMSRIEFDIKANEESILPCQYFDLIVGSGDGGLISLMLGRLGMSASSAKAAYEEIHEFIHESCANLDSNAKAQALEGRLKNLVCKEVGGDDPDLERLEEPASTKPRCKVAVLTKSALNIGAPVILRTYRVRDNRTPNCPIWLAMRASTARPNIFTEARVCGKKLISASLGHNNPIESAMHEASIAFPTARIDCIVSLGSGHPGHSELKETGLSSLALVALQLAQGSEQVSQEFARRRQSEGLGDTYFRFNVLQGLQAYIQAGYDSALAHTAAYLQETAVDTALNAAVRALRGESQSVISISQPLEEIETPVSGVLHASNTPPIQTYAYALYEEGFGLPLWDPQPLYKAKPVEIGDIGILTKFGAFEVLFNATLPAASQAPMGYRIPPDFQPLSITSSDIQIDPQILTVPFLAHGDIMPTSQGLDSIDTSHKQTQQPFNLSFAAMNGAALIIKDPPTEVALTPERSIEEYIKHNCRAWYHYYEHDPHGPRRNFRGKSLIFVTAVVQNSQWALGAWSSIKTPIRASYSGSATIGDGKFVKIAGQWAPAGRRDVKQGPLDARGTPKPKLRQQDDPENHLAQLTQTLFIRGYVIGVRETRPEILEPSKVYPLPYRSWRDFLKQIFSYGIPAILRAAASPGDLPPPPPPPMSPAVPAEEGSGGEASIVVETHELSPDRQLRHPADDIMDNMFKMDSNLDIIVVHDNTIVELIRSVEGLKKHEPEQLNIRNLEPSSESLDEQDLATKHSKFWSVDSPPADKSTPSQESPIHLPMLRKITDNSALPIPNQTPMFSKIEDDTSRVQADVDIQRLSKSQDLSVERWRNLQPTVPPSKFPDPMLDLKATLKQKSGSSPSLALIPASSRHRRPSSTNSRPQPEVIAPIQPNAPPVPVVPPLRRHQKEWPLPSVLPPGYPEGSRWIRDPTGWPRVETPEQYRARYGIQTPTEFPSHEENLPEASSSRLPETPPSSPRKSFFRRIFDWSAGSKEAAKKVDPVPHRASRLRLVRSRTKSA